MSPDQDLRTGELLFVPHPHKFEWALRRDLSLETNYSLQNRSETGVRGHIRPTGTPSYAL